MGLSDRVGMAAHGGHKAELTTRTEEQGELETSTSSTGVFLAHGRDRASLTPAKETWTRRISAHPRGAAARNTLSHRFWGLNWSAHLPRVVARNGATVEVGEWSRISRFIDDLQPELRETNHHTRPRAAQATKQRYLREECDLLELRLQGNTIGAFIGAPEDWSTYYCRLIAVNPSHNHRHFIRGFAKEALFPILAEAGVERLVGDTAPTNLIMQRLFNDLGFHPTGQQLTDRWGTMIRFTKFLDDDAAKSFAERFAPGA